jgi:hypothetical protein
VWEVHPQKEAFQYPDLLLQAQQVASIAIPKLVFTERLYKSGFLLTTKYFCDAACGKVLMGTHSRMRVDISHVINSQSLAVSGYCCGEM